MIKNGKIFLYSLFINLSLNANFQDNYLAYNYVLKIQFPSSIKNIPNLCGYYKGNILEFNGDLCVIDEKQPCDQFIIAITEEVKQKYDQDNFNMPIKKHLERIQNAPCRIFVITNQIDEKTEQKNWTVEEKDCNKLPTRLNDAALILLMNPSHVDQIKYNQNNTNNSFKTKNSSTVFLPEIIIKQNITQKDVKEDAIHALCASLDTRAIHSKNPKVLKNERNLICMRTIKN